jgi:hypothetical protein
VNTSGTTPREPSLSAKLAELGAQFEGVPVSMGELIHALSARAYELLMMLLVLPFLVPVSVPGMSTPLGLIVATVAVQLAFGGLPWLPHWLLNKKLPAGFLRTVLRATRGSVGFMERVVKPRWPALSDSSFVTALHLGAICVAALALALPMPIPLTNTFPGWAIFFLAAGLMERDGACLLLGYVMIVVTAVWFFFVGAAVQQTFLKTFHWLAG